MCLALEMIWVSEVTLGVLISTSLLLSLKLFVFHHRLVNYCVDTFATHEEAG
jgi:hypothetical protein